MTFRERDVLALFGTNCQVVVIFFSILLPHSPTSLHLYLVIILLSTENTVLHKRVVEKDSSILKQQWIFRSYVKLKFGGLLLFKLNFYKCGGVSRKTNLQFYHSLDNIQFQDTVATFVDPHLPDNSFKNQENATLLKD